MAENQTDILIVGAGLGGVAAALAACRLGSRVILTEPTDWIGGQLTAQAVPPDENPWIEGLGCTASYRALREGIRAYYRRNYPLRPEIRQQLQLNPGAGTVSRLCHEPRAALAVLEEMLAPYRASGQLQVWLNHEPVRVEMDGDQVRAVTLRDGLEGDERIVQAAYVLDATELGDLLDLGNIEHVIGAEAQSATGELHALSGAADPSDQQGVTWCFAMDYLPEEDHTIAQPEMYAFWRSYQADFWPGPHLGWLDVDPQTCLPRQRTIFTADPAQKAREGTFWHYRRIFARGHYPEGMYPSDVTLVNWPQNDYWLKPLVGVSTDQKNTALEEARQLSLSLLYWMQTEAPRADGGIGYRGLRLRGDLTGTRGLAKHVYIRESRRIQAVRTVVEQHVGVQARAGVVGAEPFADSVGIGCYRIDLHPSTGGRNYIDIACYPFQIPLGALLPVRVENLLPACKNLGTTHITNGCYRLHPVEWTIGEAAGALASVCLQGHTTPRQVWDSRERLLDFQGLLVGKLGFELAWPEYARITAV
jgi:hypothetical protein